MDHVKGPEFIGLELSHPEATRLNAAFAKLGIDQLVDQGPHRMTLRLDTPSGPAEFSGEGLDFRGMGAIVTMAQSFLGWAFACGRL